MRIDDYLDRIKLKMELYDTFRRVNASNLCCLQKEKTGRIERIEKPFDLCFIRPNRDDADQIGAYVSELIGDILRGKYAIANPSRLKDYFMRE